MCNTELSGDSLEISDIILSELKLLEISNIADIIDIHTVYTNKLKPINSINRSTVSMWYPTQLIFRNLFGYTGSNENVINFKSGVTSITAANAVGKTSIINVLLYGLFGSLLYKGTQNVDILNNKENSGYLKLTVCHDSTIYTITRELSRQPNSIKNPVVTKCRLSYITPQGTVKVLDAQLASDKIFRLFGTLDDFHKCNILNSRDQSSDFFNLTDGDKIKYLKDIFRLNIFDELLKLIKLDQVNIEKKLSEKIGECNILTHDINSMSTNNTTNDTTNDTTNNTTNDTTNDTTNNTTNPIDTMESEITTINENTESLKSELLKISYMCDDYKKQIILKESQIKKITESIEDLEMSIKELSGQYNCFNDIYNITDLQTSLILKTNELNNTITNTENELLNELTNLMNKEKNLPQFNYNKDEIFKELCNSESVIFQLKENLQTLIDTTLNQSNLTKPIKVTKVTNSEHNLLEMIDNLKKQYKDTNGNSEDEIKKVISQIKTNLKKYKNCNINEDMNYFISEREKLQKELDIIVTDIQVLTPELSNLEYPLSQCDCSELEIESKINDLKTMIKLKFEIPDKNSLTNAKYLNFISEKIDDLTTESLSNETLDSYISEIDLLCNKGSLPKKDFIKIKLILLNPIKTILLNLKSIIVKNDEIDKLIEENNKIETYNNTINSKISNYIYYGKLFQLKKLATKKTLIETNIKELNNQHNYNKLKKELFQNELLLSNIKHNRNIDTTISNYNLQLNKLKYENLNKLISEKEKELVQVINKYDFLTIQSQKNIILNKLDVIKHNNILLSEIQILKEHVEYETARHKFLEYNDKISIIHHNNLLIEEIKTITNQLIILKDEQHKKEEQLQLNIINIDKLYTTIGNLDSKRKQLLMTKDEIKCFEHKKQNLLSYAELIGPKQLQLTIIKKELKKIEITINEILSKYTKYKIEIGYDGPNLKIMLRHNNTLLKTNLLSAFESLILSTAFKRSILKHSNIPRGSLYIMDESVENMDDINFLQTLPDLLNFIMNEYSYILLISQRDVLHLSCNEIKIKKENGNSIIVQ